MKKIGTKEATLSISIDYGMFELVKNEKYFRRYIDDNEDRFSIVNDIKDWEQLLNKIILLKYWE